MQKCLAPKSRKGFSAARAIEKRSWQTTTKFIIKAKIAALNVMSDPTGLYRLGTINMQRCFDRFRNHFEEVAKLDVMWCWRKWRKWDAEPSELQSDGPDSVIKNMYESYLIKKFSTDLPLLANCEIKSIILPVFKMELTQATGRVCSKLPWGDSDLKPDSFPESQEILKEALWIFLQKKGIDPRSHIEKNGKYYKELLAN